jgi:putative transcriptional regulator
MKPSKGATAYKKLRAGLEDALAYHRRAPGDLTVRDVEWQPVKPMQARDVVAIRKQLRVSQAAFARLLNVSPRTVQAWESNLRRPSDAALKLLHIAKHHPDVLATA